MKAICFPREFRLAARTGLFVAVLTTLVMLASWGPGTVKTHAAAQRATAACSEYYAANQAYGFWDAAYDAAGASGCYGTAPAGYGILYPCSSVPVTADMDVWLSQTTNGSGRLAESGRTGNETWVADCQWHTQVEVGGYGQRFTTPLWACLWVNDTTPGVNLSFDKLCAQDY